MFVAANPTVFILVAGVALVWVLFLRPQQARQKAAREKANTIEAGDEVLTVGGIYGIVQELDDEGDLIVEIAEGIHVRVARRAVATVVKPDEDEDGGDHGDDARDDGASDGPDNTDAGEPLPADNNPPAT
jgi:preprotein translocase subunit YajC